MFINLVDKNNIPMLINTKDIKTVSFDIKSYDKKSISFVIYAVTDYGQFQTLETYTELPEFLIESDVDTIREMYLGVLAYVLNERHEKIIDGIDDFTVELGMAMEIFNETNYF